MPLASRRTVCDALGHQLTMGRGLLGRLALFFVAAARLVSICETGSVGNFADLSSACGSSNDIVVAAAIGFTDSITVGADNTVAISGAGALTLSMSAAGNRLFDVYGQFCFFFHARPSSV